MPCKVRVCTNVVQSVWRCFGNPIQSPCTLVALQHAKVEQGKKSNRDSSHFWAPAQLQYVAAYSSRSHGHWLFTCASSSSLPTILQIPTKGSTSWLRISLLGSSNGEMSQVHLICKSKEQARWNQQSTPLGCNILHRNFDEWRWSAWKFRWAAEFCDLVRTVAAQQSVLAIFPAMWQGDTAWH